MIINKLLKNQILKIVKQVAGLNDNKWELRKIQNELTSQAGRISRLEQKENSNEKKDD